MFTGSTEVARLIQAQLASRLLPNGKPVPLIAETGGQNAMIVDSSALAEQVVFDVIASAFDSAGQRCSALRVLCLQEDVADRILTMLKGALRELSIGRTDQLKVDIGPVITDEAKNTIEKHIQAMRDLGRKVEQLPLGPETQNGTFVAPTIIEIESLRDLKREVFGPVLHVVRYKRDDMESLIDDINSTGYGLTFGLHTRLDETIANVADRIRVGNIYINRNIIGAVVGVQPFGGRGLSGTGPKAGGRSALSWPSGRNRADPAASRFGSYRCGAEGLCPLARQSRHERSGAGGARYRQCFGARSRTRTAGPGWRAQSLCSPPARARASGPQTEIGLYRQLTAVLATGNTAVIDEACGLRAVLKDLPETVAARAIWTGDWQADAPLPEHLSKATARASRR